MDISQVIAFTLGYVIAFSFSKNYFLSLTLKISFLAIFFFVFLPFESLEKALLLRSLSFNLDLSFLRVFFAGAFSAIIFSLTFYVADIFSAWFISLFFHDHLEFKEKSIFPFFVSIIFVLAFLVKLDFILFFLTLLKQFNLEISTAKESLFGIASHALIVAAGFSIFYAFAVVLVSFVTILINRYLKRIVDQELVSGLCLSLFIFIFSLSLYQISYKVADIIDYSFEVGTK